MFQANTTVHFLSTPPSLFLPYYLTIWVFITHQYLSEAFSRPSNEICDCFHASRLAECLALLPPSPNIRSPFPSPGPSLNPTLEQVPKGSGGITIPESVQKRSGCATSLYSLVVIAIFSQKFDFKILQDFSSVNDSMIHFLCSYSHAL